MEGWLKEADRIHSFGSYVRKCSKSWYLITKTELRLKLMFYSTMNAPNNNNNNSNDSYYCYDEAMNSVICYLSLSRTILS